MLWLEGTTWGAPHPPDTRRGATGNRHSRPGGSGLGLSRAGSSLWPWGCLAARSPPDFWAANIGYLGPADDNDTTRTRSDSGEDSSSGSPNRIGPAAVASGQQDPEARPHPAPSRVSRPGCRVRCLDGSGGLPGSASLGRPSAGSGMGAGVTGPPRLSRVAPGKGQDHGRTSVSVSLSVCLKAGRSWAGRRAPQEFRRCWERPQGRRDQARRRAPC